MITLSVRLDNFWRQGIAQTTLADPLAYARNASKEIEMIRVATAILFALALHQPVHADLRNSNSCDVPAEHSPASEAGICRPDLPELESEAHSARNDRQAILRRIAVYLSVGNRDGAEILIAQLRSEGVSDEVLNETINWINLHDSTSITQRTEPTLPPVEPAW